MTTRVERLRVVLEERGLDAILVVQPENRRYIAGFTGSSGYTLISRREALFFTDFRYLDQAAEQCVGFEIVNQGASFVNTLSARLEQAGVKELGFEQDYLTYGDVDRYRALEQNVSGLKLVPTSGIFEALRVIKDQSEIEAIQTAANIADAGFAHIIDFLRPGLTEREVAIELETFMRKQGASGASFETIIASGWRSSLPHGVASGKVLESGDFVKMDFGAMYEGYCSDITRTVVLGQPSDKQREIYQIVLDAQLKSLDAARVGLTGNELDAVARNHISEQGYGDNFGHSLGHGIGLEIHEGPRVASTGTEVLKAGMVITIEPGIYISQWGGVRIEDDVLLLENGKRVLTSSPKLELISI